MRRTPLLILILCAAYLPAFSQGEIPVDMYTGTPSISVPLAVVSSVDVSQPVSLSYNVNSTQESPFGVGWSISTGGITRDVRGLPDDFGYGDALNRKGWFYAYSTGTVASVVGGFTPGSDELSDTYGGEATDFGSLDTYSTALIDTEPDVFSFSAGGISGKFIFDNNLNIRTIPYMDVQIVPTYASWPNDKKITGFTITTNDGYSYKYTYACSGSKRLSTEDSQWTAVHILPIQQRFYGATVTYNFAWQLTEVKSPNGNTLTYTYASNPLVQSIPDRPITFSMHRGDNTIEPGTNKYITRQVFKLVSTGIPPVPLAITGSSGSVLEFNYGSNMLQSITVRDNRKGSTPATNYVKTINLGYIDVSYERLVGTNSGSWLYTRKHLRTISETSGCDRTQSYTFGYSISNSREDETGTWSVLADAMSEPEWTDIYQHHNEALYATLYIYPSEGPKHGYRLNYIPGSSLTMYAMYGTNMTPYSTTNATLRTIDYPTGGRTVLQFEGNRYHDVKSNQSEIAAGLRIQRIYYYDGSGTSAIVKHFEYLDADGKSSGRIFRQPIYHIPAFQWKDFYLPSSTASSDFKSFTHADLSTEEKRYLYLTLRTDFDLAPADADNNVGYTRVKVSRTGSGYAIHEFQVPAIYGETVSGEWQTPITLIARQSSAISMGIFPEGGDWRFPNAPNPFYDYARGLPWKVTEYNEAGKPVRKVRTVYQDLYKPGSTAASKVYGVKYERYALSEDNIMNNRVYLFSKYFLLTDATKVPQSETVTIYDPMDTLKKVSEITEYTYSANRQLSVVKRTTSDGNIYRTRFKYPKDYANQASGEPAVGALNTLASTAFRHGAPIETVTTLQKGAGAEMVTGANLVMYNTFGQPTNPRVESQWTLELSAPLAFSSFTNSYVNSATGTFVKHSPNYTQLSTVLGYKSGLPTKVNDLISKQSMDTDYAYGNSLPLVKATNVNSTQSAFSDFDNTTDFAFGYGVPYLSEGRSGAYGFFPSVMLYKNFTRVVTGNYIISFWIKCNNPVSFTARIRNQSQTATYYTGTFNVQPTGSEYKYVQHIIPFPETVATGITALRVDLVANGLTSPGSTGFIAGLLPVIDDVFFFPEGSNLESYTYQIPYGVASVTTATGGASYIEYDGLGRERYVRDRDRNIVKKTTYQTAESTNPLFASFTISTPSPYVNNSTLFTATQPTCAGSVLYEWQWEASAAFVTGSANQSYTFTTAGEKIVTLRVSSSSYGSKTITRTIIVQPPALTADFCMKGISVLDGSTATLVDCAPVTINTANKSVFKVYNVVGIIDGVCNYTWYRRNIGATAWTQVGSNASEYVSEQITSTTRSFEVKCKISTLDNVWIEKDPIQVYINN